MKKKKKCTKCSERKKKTTLGKNKLSQLFIFEN